MNPRKDLAAKLHAILGREAVSGPDSQQAAAALAQPVAAGSPPNESAPSASGKRYWRTLEELADTEAFQELLRQEYPETAPLGPQSLSRRRFLALMGASLALAGLGGCSVRPAPTRLVVPQVRAPEETVPGRPL